METALLQYPIDTVIHRLQKILRKKGFVIISSNETQGQIKAHKRRFLRKSISLDINTSKIDELATRVDLTINSNPDLIDKRLSFSRCREQDLWNCIYDNF